jgi:hypothetical protein
MLIPVWMNTIDASLLFSRSDAVSLSSPHYLFVKARSVQLQKNPTERG